MGRVLPALFAAAVYLCSISVASAEKRVALIVANGAYKSLPLANPTVDADLVKAALDTLGFVVTVQKDANLETFDEAVNKFADDARGADVALFYFAGHGFSVTDGIRPVSLLMSTSAEVESKSERVLQAGGIPLDDIISPVAANAKATLVFVDACRNDPRADRSVAGARGRGFTVINPMRGGRVFVALSTKLGDTAEDGEPLTGSPFARAFQREIREKGVRVDDAFRSMREAVREQTNGKQIPDIVQDDLPSGSIMLAPTEQSPMPTARPEKRVALVVGIDAYQHLPALRTAVSDARLLSEKLGADGFDVELDLNLSSDKLRGAVEQFSERIERTEKDGFDPIALFYFAGQGMQDSNQSNFLLSSDTDLHSKNSLSLEGLSVDAVLQAMQQARPRISFAIFDASRENLVTAASGDAMVRGLAVVGERPGFLISFSAEPGKTALDAVPGAEADQAQPSPFAAALARGLELPGVEATQLFAQVSHSVLETTKNAQFPWTAARLDEPFYFRPGAPAGVELTQAPTRLTDSVTGDVAELDFEQAVLTNTKEEYETWLRKYPDDPHKPTVVKLIRRLTEEELWKRAESANSRDNEIALLELLLEAFEDGVYSDKARARLASLKDSEKTAALATESNPIASTSPEAASNPASANPPAANTLSSLAPVAEIPAQTTGAGLSPQNTPPQTVSIRWYNGMDAPGNDLGPWIRNTASEVDCMHACIAVPDKACVGFTYNIQRSVCILKSRVAVLINIGAVATTGVLTDRTAAPAAVTFKYYSDMDAPGSDKGSWVRNVTKQYCESLCVADVGCAGYTFNYERSTCIPKKAISALVQSHEAAITGVVDSRN
jgi:uncharacterized caspase-like protein